MPLSLSFLANKVFSTVSLSNIFSKPSLFQILYIYFLVWVFSEVMSQKKLKASHPSIKQYLCSMPKSK